MQLHTVHTVHVHTYIITNKVEKYFKRNQTFAQFRAFSHRFFLHFPCQMMPNSVQKKSCKNSAATATKLHTKISMPNDAKFRTKKSRKTSTAKMHTKHFLPRENLCLALMQLQQRIYFMIHQYSFFPKFDNIFPFQQRFFPLFFRAVFFTFVASNSLNAQIPHFCEQLNNN